MEYNGHRTPHINTDIFQYKLHLYVPVSVFSELSSIRGSMSLSNLNGEYREKRCGLKSGVGNIRTICEEAQHDPAQMLMLEKLLLSPAAAQLVLETSSFNQLGTDGKRCGPTGSITEG